jgi:signal transduction histidine kinase
MEQVYAWLRRHPRLVDAGLALVLIASGASVFTASRSLGVAGHAGQIAISLVLAGLVVFRRQLPVAVFVIASAIIVIQLVLGMQPGAFQPVTADAAIIVLLYTLAAYRPRRISMRGLWLCLILVAVTVLRYAPTHGDKTLRFMLILALELGVPVVTAWLLGDSMAGRRAYVAWLDERARQAEAERDAKAQLAAATERSRIAREMHDIIAHNLSVIIGLADGGRYAAAHSPERSGQALSEIAGTGRLALTELRQLLGALSREDHHEIDLAPQPGVTDLDPLLDRVRAAGLPVRCTVRGDSSGLSEGRQLTVYRIVQEALTNILKHADGAATAEVTLDYTGGEVKVLVADTGHGGVARPASTPARSPGAAARPAGAAARSAGSTDGQGLHGMRQRAALYDGTLSAGPSPSGGWQVEAHLPAPAPTPPPVTAPPTTKPPTTASLTTPAA